MQTLKKTTTKTVAKRSRVAVSPATKARVQKRTAAPQPFTPKRHAARPEQPKYVDWIDLIDNNPDTDYPLKSEYQSVLDEVKAEVAAKNAVNKYKYTARDMAQMSITVGLTVLVVCMFAWR